MVIAWSMSDDLYLSLHWNTGQERPVRHFLVKLTESYIESFR